MVMGFGKFKQRKGLTGRRLDGPMQDTVRDWIPSPHDTEHYIREQRDSEEWRSTDFMYTRIFCNIQSCVVSCVVWIMDVLTHYLTPFMHVPVERTDLCEAWCSDGRLDSWVTPVLLHNPLYSSFILNTSHTPHSYTHPARHRTVALLSCLPPTQSFHQLIPPYTSNII